MPPPPNRRRIGSGKILLLGVVGVGCLLAGLLFLFYRSHLPPLPAKGEEITGELKPGESLSGSLQSKGLPPPLVSSLVQVLRPLFDFRRSLPGDRYRLLRDGKGEIVSFTYHSSPLECYEVKRVNDRLEAERKVLATHTRTALLEGQVEASLFDAMEEIGERAELAMDFARIFLWDIDFHTDPRAGDRFRMIVEKLYLDGEFVKYGNILIAQYENQGQRFTAIRFRDGKGKEGYFNPEGKSMKKALLRSPLQFNRITSRFTRSRLHPILGGYRPHLAVDYKAPVGTPVWAVADGWVSSCGWSGGGGNSIALRHRMGYSTFYSHLSRFARGIRRGAPVKQGQIIGYVGSTGLATGPHLDYRIKKDGRPLNPLQKINLPGVPVAKTDQAEFFRLRNELMEQLTAGRLGEEPEEPPTILPL
ncbi:MAG: peptidoglycan DD-metalloendopeptidase family protein [candidate division NC10 bacterium]|nr:peptidoglycan DD-metalloendopeptidase family protein [candidate division NC10 bacterium]